MKENKKIFSVKEGYKSRNYTMTNDDGNLISETQTITDLFKKHFEKLLNNTRVVNRNDVYQQIIYDKMQHKILEPSLDEIIMIISSLKNNKSPGENNINSELLKLQDHI